MFKISVVIPTLNEGSNIEELIHLLNQLDEELEIIVSDGNSSDDTISRAEPFAKIVQGPRGRGVQMNAGARIGSGDILWFLHADCRPHPDSVIIMRRALTDSRVVGGAFEYNLNYPGLFFRLTEITSNGKNRILNLIYGDMGIFVRRTVFEKMGGYSEIPLMEDMDLCRRLKQYGEIVILPYRTDTSARRWIEEGILKNLLRNYALQLAWAIGVSPDTLAKRYPFT